MGCTPCAKRAAARRTRSYVPTGTTGTSDGMVYTLALRDGSTQRFGSRLEADAENARQGYTGVVKVRPQA